MSRPDPKARRVAQTLKVTARSAQSSGMVKCYVERFELPDGRHDLRLREKLTRRIVRVLSDQPLLQQLAPMSNLLQDCYAHGGGLIQPRTREEHIAIAAPIFKQNQREIKVLFSDVSVTVRIMSSRVTSPPVAIWCYVEEYPGDNGSLGLRLRQKVTGRKVEMYGRNQDQLAKFLASSRLTEAYDVMPNLYEKDGYQDYVLVSGGTAVDSYDVILFEEDIQLTYLLGPTLDTAYRDAYRVREDKSAASAHSLTALAHFEGGRYRESVLSARLAVEMACGGSGKHVQKRLAPAPPDVSQAGANLYKIRHVAVHEGGTRIEQRAAREAILAMKSVLAYLEPTSGGS